MGSEIKDKGWLIEQSPKISPDLELRIEVQQIKEDVEIPDVVDDGDAAGSCCRADQDSKRRDQLIGTK